MHRVREGESVHAREKGGGVCAHARRGRGEGGPEGGHARAPEEGRTWRRGRMV